MTVSTYWKIGFKSTPTNSQSQGHNQGLSVYDKAKGILLEIITCHGGFFSDRLDP
jgi:hypothetical protein